MLVGIRDVIIRIIGGILQDVGIEAVRMEDVLVFEGQHDDPSADLVLDISMRNTFSSGKVSLGSTITLR